MLLQLVIILKLLVFRNGFHQLHCPRGPSFSAFKWATTKAFLKPHKDNSILRVSTRSRHKQQSFSSMSEQEKSLEPGAPGVLTAMTFIVFVLIQTALPSAVYFMILDRNWWHKHDVDYMLYNSTSCELWLENDVNHRVGSAQCFIQYLTWAWLVIGPCLLLLDFELHWLAWQV